MTIITKQHKDLTGPDLHDTKVHCATHVGCGTDPIPVATTVYSGAMSSADKTSLNALTDGSVSAGHCHCHNLSTGLNEGGYKHLDASQYSNFQVLTDGLTNTLHTHYHYALVDLNACNSNHVTNDQKCALDNTASGTALSFANKVVDQCCLTTLSATTLATSAAINLLKTNFAMDLAHTCCMHDLYRSWIDTFQDVSGIDNACSTPYTFQSGSHRVCPTPSGTPAPFLCSAYHLDEGTGTTTCDILRAYNGTLIGNAGWTSGLISTCAVCFNYATDANFSSICVPDDGSLMACDFYGYTFWVCVPSWTPVCNGCTFRFISKGSGANSCVKFVLEAIKTCLIWDSGWCTSSFSCLYSKSLASLPAVVLNVCVQMNASGDMQKLIGPFVASTCTVCNFTSLMPAGQWNHIGIAHTGAPNQTRLTINGQCFNFAICDYRALGSITETYPLYIGSGSPYAGGGQTACSFTGAIEEVGIYQKSGSILDWSVLTDSYNKGLFPACVPAVLQTTTHTYDKTFTNAIIATCDCCATYRISTNGGVNWTSITPNTLTTVSSPGCCVRVEATINNAMGYISSLGVAVD